jgi:hypothetical protein
MQANGRTTEERKRPIGHARCFATAYSSREVLQFDIFEIFMRAKTASLMSLQHGSRLRRPRTRGNGPQAGAGFATRLSKAPVDSLTINVVAKFFTVC